MALPAQRPVDGVAEEVSTLTVIGKAMLAMVGFVDDVTASAIDKCISEIVVIGRVDREKVQGWVDDLKLIAVRTPVSNTRFVLTELQTIYRLLASGWSPESIDNYMIGVKRRYE